MSACLLLETQLWLELPLHFLVAMPSLWPPFLSHAQSGWEGGVGKRWVGEQHVLKKVTVCCFAVLHLVKVVTPQVPTFQPIAIHLLLPHPLPLVHPPLGAASGNLPLALHQSVQTLLRLYSMSGKASWSRLSGSSQLMLLETHRRSEAKRLVNVEVSLDSRDSTQNLTKMLLF